MDYDDNYGYDELDLDRHDDIHPFWRMTIVSAGLIVLSVVIRLLSALVWLLSYLCPIG